MSGQQRRGGPDPRDLLGRLKGWGTLAVIALVAVLVLAALVRGHPGPATVAPCTTAAGAPCTFTPHAPRTADTGAPCPPGECQP